MKKNVKFKMGDIQYQEPTKETMLDIMQKLSNYFSPKSVLSCSEYPDLKIRGIYEPPTESNPEKDVDVNS